MNLIKSFLSSAGAFLLGAGLISIILAVLAQYKIADLEVRILSWIGSWGQTAGWVIRISISALGALLYLIGKRITIRNDE